MSAIEKQLEETKKEIEKVEGELKNVEGELKEFMKEENLKKYKELWGLEELKNEKDRAVS
ncbi:15717_t:CDS:2 [Funneliformis caledonium]|uniref:15717_t:CDS:1 n=1 Tax=Funneliformis caledonium TaxID=1117310 RepID=A0A9N9D513_9GLOM|nr:15717_t:CDS:2 [Funneliformis caledonium]